MAAGPTTHIPLEDGWYTCGKGREDICCWVQHDPFAKYAPSCLVIFSSSTSSTEHYVQRATIYQTSRQHGDDVEYLKSEFKGLAERNIQDIQSLPVPPGTSPLPSAFSQMNTVEYVAVTLPPPANKEQVFVLPWHKFLPSPTSFQTAIDTFKQREAEQDRHVISELMQGNPPDTAYTARSSNNGRDSTLRY